MNALEYAPDVQALETDAAMWTAEVAAATVERLKAEADRHWGINAHHSLNLAEQIVTIGLARRDNIIVALGTMARGDALKFLCQLPNAWQALDEAGRLFIHAGDDVGWARTCIGRLSICVDLNRVDETLADAQRARTIFSAYHEYERLLRLDNELGRTITRLGDHQQALKHYHAALDAAQALGADGEKSLGPLHTNIGLCYEALGDLQQALARHEQARSLFAQANQPRHLAIAESNIANIAMTQGAYRRALRLLHGAARVYAAEQLERDATDTKRLIADCYLLLNRYAEGRDLLQEVIAAYHAAGTAYEEALAYIQLATAHAELGSFEAAQTALDTAQPIFAALNASSWEATVRLRRGRIALLQGAPDTAQQEASAAAQCFEAMGQRVPYAQAMLVHGQAALAQHDPAAAAHAARATLAIAQRCNVPGLRYTAHLLLGRAAEAVLNTPRAVRHYQAAASTVERMQRDLTIRLRPGFLEDKGEALRALITLHLRDEHTERAFRALERAKSQVLLNYLANREQLYWVAEDSHTQTLIDELAQLRQEHHRLQQATPGCDDAPRDAGTRQALQEIAACERRMRAITEQLYLHGGLATLPTSMPSQPDLQQHLSDGELVEYYNDGEQVWAFVLDRHRLTQHRLPTTVAQLDQLLAQLQLNIAAALQLDAHAPSTWALTTIAQRILQRLYTLLVAPLGARVLSHKRLYIVPYGMLHFLPFHLLHTGTAYLIEEHELVIVPTAALLPQRGPRRERGALVLAHSSGGLLPQTLVEAEIVQHHLGGQILREHQAQRSALGAPPRQVLHMAVHGEQRLDLPDLSYLHLADGQLYADDLWQHDLSYELVTLSACETGRARVAAGDELIGLGQGLLYAGAGAVISSLWRVRDDAVVQVMEHLYAALSQGESKAAALQHAQHSVLAGAPQLHPAFWGAFQLVGDAAPLSA